MIQGMEWTDMSTKAPDPARTKFRYGIGLVAPIVAWPSLLMPIEYALISQFAAFTGLYFADSTAAARGWAPTWYGTYRFVLTFIVGSAIMASLVGRAKIGEPGRRLTYEGLSESMHKSKDERDRESKWVRLE